MPPTTLEMMKKIKGPQTPRPGMSESFAQSPTDLLGQMKQMIVGENLWEGDIDPMRGVQGMTEDYNAALTGYRQTPEGLQQEPGALRALTLISPGTGGAAPGTAASGFLRTPTGKWLKPFYSEVEETVKNIAQNKAQPAQWYQMIKKSPGVKQQELDWLGLREFLHDKKSVTKQELQDFIQSNKVDVQEVVKGQSLTEAENIELRRLESKNADGDRLLPNEIERMNELLSKLHDTGTKFGEYTIPGGPLSRDTEILTDDGWKRIDSISIGETILTRKDENGELEWNEVEAVPSVWADKLFHFKNQSIDMQVTANHQMVVRKRRRSSRGIFRVTAVELWEMSECVAPLTGSWLKGKSDEHLFGLPTGDVLELIGWYLAEGSAKKTLKGTKTTLSLAQSREKNYDKCERLEGLFSRLGISWSYSGNNYFLGVKSMPRALVNLLHEQGLSEWKYIDRSLFCYSRDLLSRLLDGLLFGDGCLVKEKGRKPKWYFSSKSKQLADDVQILALLTGKRASVRQRKSGLYISYIAEKQWASIDDAKYAEVDYNNYAFCVTVKNHAIYVRRNGIAAFTGNSNYRELLLTLPNSAARRVEQITNELTDMVTSGEYNRDKWFALTQEKERLLKQGGSEQAFRGGHFDEPNVLAHIRFNDRVDSSGKKVLFLEEVQSDWAQRGRKEGFKSNSLDDYKVVYDNGIFRIRDKNNERIYIDNVVGYSSEEAAWQNLKQNINKIQRGVPNMPFKKTWQELAMKRMIRWAAEHDYDKIAWTTGAQQAKRYDLSKQVDRIVSIPKEDGTHAVRIEPTDGPSIKLMVDKNGIASSATQFSEQFNNKPLSDIVGKEMADKITGVSAQPILGYRVVNKISGNGSRLFDSEEEARKAIITLPERTRSNVEIKIEKRPVVEQEHFFEGEDLKIGGEGMKAFYDRMLPQFLNKFTKKWGGKVQDMMIGGRKDVPPNLMQAIEEQSPETAKKMHLGGSVVHSLTITDKMRQSAKKGMPLFSAPVLPTPSFERDENR